MDIITVEQYMFHRLGYSIVVSKVCMALKGHSPPETKSVSDKRVFICSINQLLDRIFHNIEFKVSETNLAANRLEYRLYVF